MVPLLVSVDPTTVRLKDPGTSTVVLAVMVSPLNVAPCTRITSGLVASKVPPVIEALLRTTSAPFALMMPPVLVTATPLLKVSVPLVASMVEVFVTVAPLTKRVWPEVALTRPWLVRPAVMAPKPSMVCPLD